MKTVIILHDGNFARLQATWGKTDVVLVNNKKAFDALVEAYNSEHPIQQLEIKDISPVIPFKHPLGEWLTPIDKL